MKIFTQLPEELFEHILYRECKNNDWFHVLIILLRRAAYSDQVDLKKGQVRISIRQLAVEAKVNKGQAERAIDYWCGVTGHKKIRLDLASVLAPFFSGQKTGQKTGHEICVYNILLKGFYENNRTENRTENRTANRTATGQQQDTFPRENQTEAKRLEAIEKDYLFNAPGADEVGAPTRRFFALDKKTKTFTGMTNKDIEGWQEHYKYLNPLDYLEEMADWLIKHKSKEYQANIPRKFFTNWFAKHNEINQSNTKKGRKDDRSSLTQGERNTTPGRYIDGKLVESELVSGAGFYNERYSMPKMQKK